MKNSPVKAMVFLAPIVGSDFQYVTARGSHTTAAVRCYACTDSDVRGVHQALCDDNGNISQAEIFEMAPSTRQAIDGIM